MLIDLLIQIFATCVLLIIVSLVIVNTVNRRIARLEQRLDQAFSMLAVQQSESKALLAGATGVGEKIRLLEKQLKHHAGRLPAADGREVDSITLKRALEMVKQGAEAADLVTTLGLAQGEAELMVMIHRSQKESTPS
ncbi:MAG: DUF2802 domain-containing protein [Pseudomonadota bacterium]